MVDLTLNLLKLGQSLGGLRFSCFDLFVLILFTTFMIILPNQRHKSIIALSQAPHDLYIANRQNRCMYASLLKKSPMTSTKPRSHGAFR